MWHSTCLERSEYAHHRTDRAVFFEEPSKISIIFLEEPSYKKTTDEDLWLDCLFPEIGKTFYKLPGSVSLFDISTLVVF